MSASNYSEQQLIFQNSKTTVFKLRGPEDKFFACKVLGTLLPTRQQTNQFYNEFDILRGIKIKGVRSVLEATEWEGRPALLLEYIEGINLKEALTNRHFNFEEQLNLSIQLAISLSELHQHLIIHKDICPRNILINLETKRTYLIDFEFATQLDLKTYHLGNPEQIQGTLAYISPEQTGRMNRKVDYRSDLYSLGVCYYELFTGQLPFLTEGPMELVYCHLARIPQHPSQLNPLLPKVLGDIIIKLLAKNAEDRYQSALGLKKDLEVCLKQWKQKSSIQPFPLAKEDFSDRFQIPQKLYGREKELEVLIGGYRSISDGNFLLLLVGGYSGVGKSSLVYEVHKPITENRGIFVEGKFDQYQRDIPYYAWRQAFGQFVDLLLTESPAKLETWKNNLLQALEEEGKVLTDFLPNMEKIVGPQPDVPKFEAIAQKNRFNRLILAFIRVISRAEHPLFVFIDDWQWADASSIELLSLLTKEGGSPYFMVTGAYRNNEITTYHPFKEFLEDYRKQFKFWLLEITLDNLNKEDVNLLLADTLHQSPIKCQELAKILYTKTGGNAFFLRQMLDTLHEKKVLKYQFSSGKWSWDQQEILQLKIADNVVELMIEKIKQVPEVTQQVLKLAACIGTLFKLQLLSIISLDTEENVRQKLHPALLGGYLIPIGTYFTFAHDKIQQAVYSMISVEERKKVHYKIGKLLWRNSKEQNQVQEQLFDITNQLIAGKEFIGEEWEKTEVAILCLKSGVKAMAANSYESANRYLRNGISFLGEPAWNVHYSTMMELYMHYADSELNLKQPEKAYQLLDYAFEKASNDLDRTKILEKKGWVFHMHSDHQKALFTFLQGLRFTGFSIPESTDALQKAIEQEKKILDDLLLKTSPTSILTLPYVKDPLIDMKMNLLVGFAFNCQVTGKPKAAKLSTMAATRLVFLHGPNDGVALIFALFSSMLAVQERYTEAGQFAELAIKLVEKSPHSDRIVHTLTRAGLWGMLYGKHLRESIPVFELALRLAKDQDQYPVNYATVKIDSLFHRIAMGDPIDQLLDQIEVANQAGHDCKYLLFCDICQIEKDLLLHLADKSPHDSIFPHQLPSKRIFWPDSPFFKGFFTHNELQFYCWFPEEVVSLEFLDITEKDHQTMATNIKWGDFDFYAFLFIDLRYPDILKKKEEPYWSRAVTYCEKLRRRAEACPDNFLHKYYLVKAESDRRHGNILNAIDYYTKAIEAAKKFGFTHIHALAHELSADFYIEYGLPYAATGHLLEARKSYHKWGAFAKVKYLEEKYPDLFKIPQKQPEVISNSSTSRMLDNHSLLKASQALSGEIVLSNLLLKMLPLVIENAGAQEGTILNVDGENLTAIARATSGGINEVSLDSSLNTFLGYPLSIAHYVLRTKETIVLSEALKSDRFSQDPYIKTKKPLAILCFPIFRRREMKLILYLENNLTAGAFTSDRLEVLEALSVQISISMENAQLYDKVEKALNEQVQLADAFSRFVPREFIRNLGHKSILDVRLGDQVQGTMSVLFADIRGYTTLSEQMTPKENFYFINAYHKRIGPIISTHGGFIGQYYGDGFMAIFMHNPQLAIQAAVDMQNKIQEYNKRRLKKQRQTIRVGIGIHTGDLMMGIIGDEKRMDTAVISDAVNTASRLEGLTKHFHSKIIISESTFQHLEKKSGVESRFLGKVAVKGKQQILPIYEIFNPEADEIDRLKTQTKLDFEAGLNFYFNRDFLNATLKLKAVSQKFPEDPITQLYLRRAAHFLVEDVPEEWTGAEQMDGK